MNRKNNETQSQTTKPGRLQLSRRRFLAYLGMGLSAAAAGLIGLPIIGFLFAPLFETEPEVWRDVGSVDSFKVGDTVSVVFKDAASLSWAGLTADTAVWLRRDSVTNFTAFAINCTHLGCPVNWLSDAELFMCPCHGGVYNKDGAVVAGPPPKALTQHPVRVTNNKVEIRTTPLPITE